MARDPNPSPDDAIRRALEAERQADEAVARCREEAEGILEQARARARRIADRANERIALIHRRCTHRTAAAVDDMLRDNARRQRSASRDRDTDAHDTAGLRQAAQALAGELTGAAPGDEDR